MGDLSSGDLSTSGVFCTVATASVALLAIVLSSDDNLFTGWTILSPVSISLAPTTSQTHIMSPPHTDHRRTTTCTFYLHLYL